MSTYEHLTPEHEGSDDRSESRRAYMREYQRVLRQKRKRLEVSLTVDDYDRLRLTAEDHGMKVATFAKATMLAYLDERFVLPDPERVADLELAIRRLTTEVNRLSRRTDPPGEGGPLDVADLNERLQTLEDAVSLALRDPPPLLELVEFHAQRDPRFAALLRRRLGDLTEDES